MKLKIGVLALQGAFAEHEASMKKLGADVVQVRLPRDLEGLDGLIVPGGESTSMGLIAERSGMLGPLREWVKAKKPTFGTCAGMIMLSNSCLHQKFDGQSLLGGLDVTVDRNYFGRQIQSFEVDLEVDLPADADEGESDNKAVDSPPPPPLTPAATTTSTNISIATSSGADDKIKNSRENVSRHSKFHGVFIRAPAILGVTSADVKVLAKLAYNGKEVIVAVEQGTILATAFHPELTPGLGWHRHFLHMVEAHNKQKSI